MTSLPATTTNTEWYRDVPRTIRTPALTGLILMALAFGGFGTWGATAPLSSAVIAQGTFVATGSNKIIQHLEGGMISSILVDEGDQVAEGQALIKLDETAARADARQLQIRLLRLQAIKARLEAVASGVDTYTTPDTLSAFLSDPEVAAIDSSQREHFQSTILNLANRAGVLEENITALRFQHEELVSHISALERQRDLVGVDLEAQRTLFDRGVVTRSDLNEVERAMAQVDGDLARLKSDVQISLAQIERYEREIEQLHTDQRQSALDEMQDVEAEMETLREEIRDAEDILARTEIVAPVTGVVVRMHYHTSGGVIASGTPILEILPSDVPLIIEAQVPRMQIDDVALGQAATIRLPALNQRTTPMLEGEVIYVSADSIAEQGATNNEIYVARVNIPAQQLARVDGFSPTPGMPAEILIRTEERTFFEYLTKPIVDSMSRAFRER